MLWVALRGGPEHSAVSLLESERHQDSGIAGYTYRYTMFRADLTPVFQ